MIKTIIGIFKYPFEKIAEYKEKNKIKRDIKKQQKNRKYFYK